MKTEIFVLALSSILAATIKESGAVKCYSCTYFPPLTTEEKCKDEFDKSAGVEQMDCQYGCFKSKAVKDDLQIVSRGCAPQKVDDGCKTATVNGVEGDECYCSSDLCNTATTTKASVIGLISLVALTIVYKMTY